MTPKKPARMRAVEEACVAQQRIADALMGLAAFEGADLEGSLTEITSAMGRLQQAKLAVRAAIIERDGEARFPGGANAQLVTTDDKGAQRKMARDQNARVDLEELRKAGAA